MSGAKQLRRNLPQAGLEGMILAAILGSNSRKGKNLSYGPGLRAEGTGPSQECGDPQVVV